MDTRHVLIYEQARPSADDLKAVKTKATLAGLLGVEAGRRADQLASQLDQVRFVGFDQHGRALWTDA